MTAPFNQAGRAALVTGAGRNIGRAIALALAAQGVRVAVNVRSNVAEGQAVVDEISAAGGEALLVRADVTRRHEVEAMVAAVLARFGRLDILVNNASLRAEAGFAALPYAQWRSAFDVTVDDQTIPQFMLALQGPQAESLLQPLVDVDLGPAKPVQGPGWPERCKIKPAKYIVEHAVHFAVQREERIVLVPASDHLASAITPRNQILHCHGHSPLS